MTSNQTNPRSNQSLADEATLVRNAQHGDRGALEQLVARVRPRLVHLLQIKTECLADAEDMAQMALVRAIERIDQHDGRRSFSAWLYRIALRLVVDYQRKSRVAIGLDGSGIADRRASDPVRVAADNELRANVWSLAQDVLSDEQYTVLWLRYGEDLTMRDIAQTLGRTRISTRVLLHRARVKLAPHVQTLADHECRNWNGDGSATSASIAPATCPRGDM